MAGLRSSSAMRISDLDVDCDKDWKGRGVSGIKEVVLSMLQGGVIHRAAAVLENLPYGTDSQFLQTRGAIGRPVWWRSK